MKLGIVIPLKSKKVAKNWNLTVTNLLKTINSIKAQSDRDFSVIVVGHELPSDLVTDPSISNIINSDVLKEIPPPQETDDKQKNQILYEMDRCSKILKGICILKETNPRINYWFPLDADDLLHRDFIKTLKKLNPQDQIDAFILNKGYIYYESSATFVPENNFSLYCGSSAIIADRKLVTPQEITNTSYQDFLFGQVPHTMMLEFLQKNSFKISVPDDRIIVYCKDHGENISDETRPKSILYAIKRKLKIVTRKIYFIERIQKNFSIENPEGRRIP